MFECLTQFFENLTKKRLCQKIFEKVGFDVKNGVLGLKLVLADIFSATN